MTDNDACPCQSGRSYNACCRPYHQGEAAPTPEALMRSRYSAFALGLPDYLLQTWHPDTRPGKVTLDDGERWVGLTILEAGAKGELGWVHFRAISQEGNAFAVLEERSNFVLEAGRWYYRDGEHEVSRLVPGRNDTCPCGSGRKFKKCCGA